MSSTIENGCRSALALAMCLAMAGCGDDDGGSNHNANGNVLPDAGGPSCGNGLLEGMEECDDGEGNSDTTPDACRTDCSLAWCGDGVADTDEECDLGGQNSDSESDTCRTNCENPFCGDGIIDPGNGEACEDGNTVSGDGCSPTCWTEVCGDGVSDPAIGETCDDGNTISGDGCSEDCESDESCGNLYVDTAAGEACDDGNQVSGDGCSADCLSSEFCGNGYTDSAIGEECDDGNSVSWDGCDGCAVVEFQVNTWILGSQYNSSVSVADDGRFVVVWRSAGDQDGDGFGIFAQRYHANGTRDGTEFQVNTTYTDSQDHPVVYMHDDGSFVVIWESADQCMTNRDCVVGQRFDATGAPVGGEFLVSATTEDQTWPAVDGSGDGGFVVVWEHGYNDEIRARVYNASGAPTTGELVVEAGGGFGAYVTVPDVAMGQDGRFVVVWTRDGADGDGQGIRVRRYDASGAPVAAASLVNTYVTSHQSTPVVDMAGDGRFVVVWISDGQDLDGYGIFGQRYDAQGNPDGVELQVNTTTTGVQERPAVAMGDLGDFVVAWQSASFDGSMLGVALQRFTALGAPAGGEHQANVCFASDQRLPEVDFAADGSFVAVWASNEQDGSSNGIFAQRYDATGIPLGVGP